jgi:tetratricopeptide (TPR) repeat protein
MGRTPATSAVLRYGWLVAALACIVVYAPSLGNPFHYDDEHSVLLNPHLRDLARVPSYFTDPTTFSVDPAKAMYRPLLLVTYALNFALGGEGPWSFHLVNLGIHAAAAATVWWLARLLLGHPGVALLAGLLFAVHPLASEPVNYVSSRSESLAGLFYLLAIGFFVRARQRGSGWGDRMSGLALILGLLVKSIVVTLPAVLLLYDYLVVSGQRLERLRPRLWRCHAPQWAVVAVYVALIWSNGFLKDALQTPARDQTTQLLTQVKALAYYLLLLCCPARLNVEHQFFEQVGFRGAALWGSGLLLASCLFLLVRLLRQRRGQALFLVLSAGLVLLPTLVMPLNVLVNEHRLYVTTAIGCLGLALALSSIRAWPAGWLRLAPSAAVLLVYALLGAGRTRAWASDFALWEDAQHKSPRMPRVHLYLGNAHKDAALRSADPDTVAGHWQAAVRCYQVTDSLGSTSASGPERELALRAANNLGAVQFMLGDIDAAEQAYRRALDLSPTYADALVNLGSVYHERGRRVSDPQQRARLVTQATDYYRQALDLQPNHARGYANLALAYYDLGDLSRAREVYARAYRLTPDDYVLLNNMGNLYLDLAESPGQADPSALLREAARLFSLSSRANPAYAPPRQGLERAQRRLGALPR